MTGQAERAERIVSDYLAAVDRAAGDVPADRRAELLADLHEHIVTARAELDPETEAGVRSILDRLGDPEVIAAEARHGAAAAEPRLFGSQAAGPPPGRPSPPRRPDQPSPGVGRGAPPQPVPSYGQAPAQVSSSRFGTVIIVAITALFALLVTACCLGIGVYAMRGGGGRDPIEPGNVDPPRPRPSITAATG
jgi:hypothetical protein